VRGPARERIRAAQSGCRGTLLIRPAPIPPEWLRPLCEAAGVYVGDVGGRVYELDVAGDVLREFVVPGRPQGLGLSADGRELYAAGEDGDLIVLDLETGAEIARVALGAGGFGLAVTPDQTEVWVTAPAAGRVFVLDRASRTVQSTIDVGGAPRRLAFDWSGALAVIADEAGAIRFVR